MGTKIIACLCFLYIVIGTNALDCKDENNNSVDWFVGYKIPIIKNHGDILEAGLGYVYMTSEKYGLWKFSKLSISDKSSITGNTLHDFYKNRTNLSYILYNDEPPNHPTSSSKGHTKGMVATDLKEGFWLVHSIPHFPELGKTYSYPSTGTKNGQTFLCISMNIANIDRVGLQLQYNEPRIYLQNVVASLKSTIPDFAKAADNVTIKSAPWNHVNKIISKNRVEFVSFAKSKEFGQDLYVDFVAPYLKNDLEVETWPNGVGRLRSNCSQQYKINNINSINMTVANLTFTTTSDHSKWAVSARSSGGSWACVGDINRDEHQKVRGGGTVCLNNKKVTGNFQKLIGTVEDCSKYFYGFDDLPTALNV